MNLVDGLILLLVAAQAVRWARSGFVLGVFSLGGAVIGLIIGFLVAPFFVGLTDDLTARLIISVGVILLIGLSLSNLGRILGFKLSRQIKNNNLRKADATLGASFSVVMTLLVVWLMVTVFSGIPSQRVNDQIRHSFIIQQLNDNLPPPPALMARLSNYINPNLFPRVFTGLEPRPVEPVEPPSSELLQQALAATEGAVVRIESIGCGGLVTGSGFLVDHNLVVTNAHVVAGVNQPTILNSSGRFRATPVVFDPELDIAILRVETSINAPALVLSNELLPRGTGGATLGYPGGGSLEVVPAAILRDMTATGRNIYGSGLATRQVYELQTQVNQGNSGGPVVLEDGTVFGVIFARSDSNDNLAYAVTSPSITPLIDQARNQDQVSTQRCVR